jgi:hypothetical protein
VDHLLLQSEIASALKECYVYWCWVMPKQVVDLFACWKGLCGNPRSAVVWMMAFCGFFRGKEIIEVLNTTRGQ